MKHLKFEKLCPTLCRWDTSWWSRSRRSRLADSAEMFHNVSCVFCMFPSDLWYQLTYTVPRRYQLGLNVIVREWCDIFYIISKSFSSRFQLSFSDLSVDQHVHTLVDDSKQLKQAFMVLCDMFIINTHLVDVISVWVSTCFWVRTFWENTCYTLKNHYFLF